MRKTRLLFFLALISGAGILGTDLKIGGMVRVRPEFKQNKGFVESTSTKDHYIGQKTQVFFEKNFDPGLSAKITFQDSRIWGGQAASISASDTATESQATDIREAYLRYPSPTLAGVFVTLGRQILSYGDQRLVGASDWGNVGRSFDAARVEFLSEINKLDIFASVVSEKAASDGQSISSGSDVLFNGLYNSLNIWKPLVIETYYLALLNVDDRSSLKLHTAGLRANLKPEKGQTGIDFTLEGAYQGGKKATRNVNAYAVAIQGGYTLDLGIKFRVSAEFDYASGDSDAADDRHQTFSNLFPTNHGHYGQADLFSWQNSVIGIGKLQAFFGEGHDLSLAYLYGARANENDKWYNAGMSDAPTAFITNSSSVVSGKKHLVHEVDLNYYYKIYQPLTFHIGVAYVLRGEALRDVSKPSDYLWATCMMTLQF